MWFLIACVAHHPPLRLDPNAQITVISPATTGNPHTVDLVAVANTDQVEFWVAGVRAGQAASGSALRWRAPEGGTVRVDAYAMRDGVAVARHGQKIEVGVGLSESVAAIVDEYPTDGSMGFYWPPDDGVWWGTTRDVYYAGALISPASPDRSSHCVGLTWEVAMAALEAEAGGDTFNGMSPEQLAEFRTDWFVRRLLGAGAAEAVGGIGYHEDRFGEGGISKSLFYVARLWQAEDWVPPPVEAGSSTARALW